MRRLFGASLLVSLAACTLSRGTDGTCDPLEGLQCPLGFNCFAHVCVPDGGCVPGSTDVCVTPSGKACRTGVIHCDNAYQWSECDAPLETCNGLDDDCDDVIDDSVTDAPNDCELTAGVCGRWPRACVEGQFEPVCTISSYGPFYERVEVSCDGHDNDCDGFTDVRPDGGPPVDEARLCAKQSGVCEGSHPGCATFGAEFVCSPETYRAHAVRRGERFEELELSCDGRDNDCDGRVDRSEEKLLFTSGGYSFWSLSAGDATFVASSQFSGASCVLLTRVEDGKSTQGIYVDCGAAGIPSTVSASVAALHDDRSAFAVGQNTLQGSGLVRLGTIDHATAAASFAASFVAPVLDSPVAVTLGSRDGGTLVAAFTSSRRLWSASVEAADDGGSVTGIGEVRRADGGSVTASGSRFVLGSSDGRVFLGWMEGREVRLAFLTAGRRVEEERTLTDAGLLLSGLGGELFVLESANGGQLQWLDVSDDGGTALRGARPVLEASSASSLSVSAGPRGLPVVTWTYAAADGGLYETAGTVGLDGGFFVGASNGPAGVIVFHEPVQSQDAGALFQLRRQDDKVLLSTFCAP